MILVLSWTFLRCRYRLTHIGGMALGLMSVVVLVWVDIDDGKGGISSGGNSFVNKLALLFYLNYFKPCSLGKWIK